MEDSEILALFEARDEAALRELDARYGALCRSAARNILGSDADAEECFNDALLRAWNAIPPESPTYLRAYLLKLTRGVAIDRLRASGAAKRGGGELPLVLDELAECVPGGLDTEDEALAKALGEAVSRFLAELPQRDRTIFVRRCFMVEPHRDIARSLGMRENTVAVILRRTRQRLRAYLTKEGYLQ
jgi:RNA polymerase sigma-70 factor (ECF subfamily)